MFNTKRVDEPYSKAEDELIRNKVTCPAYNLVPETHFYGEVQRTGKESLYSNFLKSTRPDEFITSAFEKHNRIEAERYHILADNESATYTRTGKRILRMQDSDVYELDRQIAAKELTIEYLKSLI